MINLEPEFTKYLKNKELQNTGLSNTELSIVLGGILGDGSLKKHTGYKNARYSFRHSISQKEYLIWKANQLSKLNTDKFIFLQKADGFSKNSKLRYCSGAKESLTKVLNLTHNGNAIDIKRKWLNHLTPLSLAIWWCDDGSLLQTSRTGCIATDGFSKEAQDIIIAYFNCVWKIDFKCYKVNVKYKDKNGIILPKQYYRLYLTTNELKKLLTIIMPHIPCAEMVYKCAIRYKDQQCQERWISQMEDLLPDFLKFKVREIYETSLTTKTLNDPERKI